MRANIAVVSGKKIYLVVPVVSLISPSRKDPAHTSSTGDDDHCGVLYVSLRASCNFLADGGCASRSRLDGVRCQGLAVRVLRTTQ